MKAGSETNKPAAAPNKKSPQKTTQNPKDDQEYEDDFEDLG